jgi:serine/threonine protein phosphatase 1
MRFVNYGGAAPRSIVDRIARVGRAGIRNSQGSRHRPRQLPEGIRIYAIGDVHGCADLLIALFAAIDADIAARPHARILHIFLGDYIDRGPDSRRAIDLVIARSRIHETVLLKGNHETLPSQFLRDPSMLRDWRLLGGFETLMSYGLRPTIDADRDEQQALARRFAAVLPASHVQFFGKLRTSFCCGDFFFVHAGVKPGVPLARQCEEDMLWIRHDFLHHEEDFGKMIIHGHTPVHEVDFHDNRINIDTGAYATGRLTCLAIEGDRLAVLNTVGLSAFG